MKPLTHKFPFLFRQIQWILIGILAGLYPTALLFTMPPIIGIPPLPKAIVLAPLLLMALSIMFAAIRYRMLDVNDILHWVLAHVTSASFLSCILFVVYAMDIDHPIRIFIFETTGLTLTIGISIFFYASLRSILAKSLAHITGKAKSSPAEALQLILNHDEAKQSPSDTLVLAIHNLLCPKYIHWIEPTQENEALFLQLVNHQHGLLGMKLSKHIPSEQQVSLFFPVSIRNSIRGLLVHPAGALGWNRRDMILVKSLIDVYKPLQELSQNQSEANKHHNAMSEQREQVLLEINKDLNLRLSEIHNLSTTDPRCNEEELCNRTRQIQKEVTMALNALRTSLSVLSTHPRSLGQSLLALCLRLEKDLANRGIYLEYSIDDATTELQLDSSTIYGICSKLQNLCSSIAPSSEYARAILHIRKQEGNLVALLTDTTGEQNLILNTP